MKRTLLAAAGLALLMALTGCTAAAKDAPVAPPKNVAQAAQGFHQTDDSGGLKTTLTVEPLQIGENHFVVSFDSQNVQAAEAQVVMATMGHGQVVDLTQNAAGKWEVTTPALYMDGKWMIRIKATLTTGEEKAAVFQFELKP